MKDGRTISSGNRVKKRHNLDDFIRNFHKKLKIENDSTEIIPIPIKHTSNALILYKNPTTPLIPDTVPKDFFDSLDKQILLPNDSLSISSNYLKMEHLFSAEIEGKEIKTDEKGSEMILD